MNFFQKTIKRVFDIAASVPGTVLFIIPSLLLAFIIKISSKGPVFFIQYRIGRYGIPFKCIKFRTMYTDSEKEGSVTTKYDSRITPIGKFLRRFKLDELPQLWNVFIGKMSFVGPRPDVEGYADKLEGDAKLILELRPGITGPATIYFRNEEELLANVENPQEYNDTVIWPKKIQLNLEYLDNWSFWKDVGYILVTLFPILDGIFGLMRRYKELEMK